MWIVWTDWMCKDEVLSRAGMGRKRFLRNMDKTADIS